jgi:hypothetical protein
LALLTSLTTLHIAIKLYDFKQVKISTLASLSRGQFSVLHIEEMERKVLFGLNWKLHPPTEFAFVTHILLFLPAEANDSVRKELFELSRYITELAVCDTFFVDVQKSTVAFAAILNVMDEINYTQLPAGIREKFMHNLVWKAGLNLGAVSTARARLRTIFVSIGGSACAPPIVMQEDDLPPIGSKSSKESRPRANSIDSIGSRRRCSPAPHRRLAGASPLTSTTGGRGYVSGSPIAAGVP